MTLNNPSVLTKICDYLYRCESRGCRYHRAKDIAADLNLTSREVGYYLQYLAVTSTELDVRKWGCSKSTSWKVTPRGK